MTRRRLPNCLKGKKEISCFRRLRIRCGAADNHIAFAILAVPAATRMDRSYDMDFHQPCAPLHSGDYDLQELFVWIDTRCKA